MKASPIKPLNNTEMDTLDTVKDFVAYRLKRSGYSIWEPNFPSTNPTPPMKTFRILGEQFERSYFSTFESMVEDFDITAPDAEENFKGVALVLFQNGIKWGRIVGLIVFSSQLSIKTMEAHRREMVDSIVHWTCSILNSSTMSVWLRENGGWNGFVEFYRHPENNNNNGDLFTWNLAWKVGIATLAGAAAVMNLFRS